MRKESNTIGDLIITLLALWAIKSLLDDDSKKIVSDRGAEVLENEDLMKKIDSQIKKAQSSPSENPEPITVSLD